MKHTQEQIDNIVAEFIDSINWNKTYEMFLRVKELCGIPKNRVSEKTPNQLRRWVENRAYKLMTTEDLEVGYRIETNCIIIEYVEDNYLEMSFKFGPEYEDEDECEVLEFIPENFKQPYDNSPEPPDLIVDIDILRDDADLAEFLKIITSEVIKTKNPYIRFGQAVFNYVEHVFGDVARKVQFEDKVDCFYNDDLVKDFLKAVWKRIKK